MNAEKKWHLQEVDETIKTLGADPNQGLSEKEAQERLEKYGKNAFEAERGPSALRIFLEQFNDFMIGVLFVAALIAGVVLKEVLDTMAIFTILILNAILGFVQEMRAQKAMEALKRLGAPSARVLRGGGEREISAQSLVPGDIILLEAGDLVPADSRLIECVAFRTQEAALTGESESEIKDTGPLGDPDTPLGDRTNLVFLGTTVVSGRAKAVVIATGKATEMGQIAQIVQQREEKTPLQIELQRVGKRIALLSLAVAGVVFLVGGLRGDEWALMFLTGVTLAVAAIPEGLPAIVTISLALGVQRMAKKNAIIRKLHAVETLGATTVILTDKTGTLTQNKMEVEFLFTGDKLVSLTKEGLKLLRGEGPFSPRELDLLLEAAILNNDARRGAEKIIGDPTEVALLVAAEQILDSSKKGLDEKYPRRMEIPFDATRKMMTTVHKSGLLSRHLPDHKFDVLVKGALEEVLKRCSRFLEGGKIKELDEGKRESLLNLNNELAAKGYRILGFGFKGLRGLPREASPAELEQDLTFVGLIGMLDPPREEVPQAVKTCQDAKVKVIMVTGDHQKTAEAIAEKLGLLNGKRSVTGETIEKISESELQAQAENIAVYSRVDPFHKLKIMKAYKGRAHVVAMTGDGINDAPAVKQADIGIAMGKIGTDVTREASDMTLADDNFATIVSAIREGRLIFENLKKFVFFLLSCNASEVLTMFVAIIVWGMVPLLPIQILWINLITDGLPALALGIDPPEADLMARAPRPIHRSILAKKRIATIFWQGGLLTLGSLSAFGLALFWLEVSLSKAQTMAFTALVLIQLLHAFNFRSQTKSVFNRRSLANKFLVFAFGGSLLLQIGILYLPLFQPFFRTQALNLKEWGVVLAVCVLPIVLIDLTKRGRGGASDWV